MQTQHFEMSPMLDGELLDTESNELFSENRSEPSQSTEEEQESVLEYARRLKLSSDFLRENPLSVVDCKPYGEDDILKLLVPNEKEIMEFYQRASLPEKLTLNASAKLLLRQACSPGKDLDMEFYHELAEKRKAKELKFELPLLSTDPALDIIDFGSLNKGIDEEPLSNLPNTLPEASTTDLEWLPGFAKSLTQIEGQCSSEKLVIDRKELAYLGGVLRKEFLKGEEADIIEMDIKYRKVRFCFTA